MYEDMQAEYIHHLGSDDWIADTARVSFGKEAKEFTKERNERLIKYLAKHNHWSPFAHSIVAFRMTAPIFVSRQLAKHQIGFAWNEISRRYVDYQPTFFKPDDWRSAPPDNIKQGSGEESPYHERANELLHDVVVAADTAYTLLNNLDIAPEQARMVLPQNMMTKWIWTGSLYAWSRVWKLRVYPTAQKETRDLITMIGPAMEQCFPIAWRELTNESPHNS